MDTLDLPQSLASVHFERYRNMTRKVQLILSAAVAVAVGGIATRDARAAAAVRATPSGGLAEIVVTATRRRTTVQTTPISITAVTSAQIASRGLIDLDSLVTSVPGLATRNPGGPGQMEFEVRGLNSQGGNSSMVGVYFGDTPLSTAMGSQIGKGIMNPGLYDIERVEVLRGPQGTLYGLSSMGGTVRVIPKPPQLRRFAASGEEVLSDTTGGGGLNHQENGMINIPLGRTAAVRLVGSFTRNSGWIKRLVLADGAVTVDAPYSNPQRPSNFYTAPLQEALNGVNTTSIDAIRAELLWKPVSDLTIEPIAMYQLANQGAPAAVDVNGSPTNPQMPAIKAHYEIYDTPETQRDSFSLGSLKVEYQMPTFSLTSATGFWHRNYLDIQDPTEELAAFIPVSTAYDAAAGGLGPVESVRGPGVPETDDSRQLSEELRAASSTNGPVHWVVGYFYQDLHSVTGISSLMPQAVAFFGGPYPYVASSPQVMTQNSVYGHLSWRFLTHFVVAVGLRHFHYSLAQSISEFGLQSPFGTVGDTVPFHSSASIASNGTIPSFTLTYDIDANHMLYAKVSKGFRLGGATATTGAVPVVPASNTNPLFAAEVTNECQLQQKVFLTTNCNPNILLQAPTTFSSDRVWSYELGEKSFLFNHHMIADLDAYLEDWNNPQVATNVAGWGITVNGGDARIKGVEAQLQALLPGGFDLSLNAAYTDARFVASSGITGIPAGMRIPDTPQVSGSAVLHWEHYLTSGMSLFGTVEDDYTGARTDLPFGVTATLLNINQVLVHLPAYSIANLRFGIRNERDSGTGWTMALFVNNVANTQALLDPQPQITLVSPAFTRYVVNRPLTIGVDVSYEFH